MLKLKLTAEQTDELTFPVGCLVWYNFPDDDVESPILTQGVVESVTLDYGSKNLIYTVVYIHDNGKIIDEIIEHDNNSVMSTTNMAYGTNCPVIIDSKYDGIVLLPERSCSTTTTTLEEGGGKGGTKTFHYTVMIYMTGGQSRYEFGVEAHRIKYRKVVPTTTVVAIGEELLVLQDADAIVATPNHATVDNGAVQPTIIVAQAKKKKTVVPSSITVEADNNNKRKCDEMDESSPLTITPPMMRDSSYHNNDAAAHSNAIVARSIDEDLHKHETSKSSSINGNSNVICDGGGTHRSSEGINSSNFSRDDGGTHRISEDVNDNKIVMTIPEWIQWNHDYCRQDLFFHLVGSKHDKEGKITVQDIAHETKCKVVVKCPRIGEPQFSITITIWTTRVNQYGHDYIQVGGPVNPATCRLSEVEIHNMIRKRMEYKFRKDFNSADNMYNILQQAGVFVHDPTGQWRADGKDEIEVGVLRKPFLDLHRLADAREKVQDLLLDYLDYIDDPGAKGRLSYETALSCTGCHRPVDCTSSAVEWKGPNWSGFISLVELPKCNEGRSFNASTILDEQESQNIQRLGCSIKIYGDAFGVPLKYCDPYLLVSGGTWQNVDKAVEIVRNAKSNHYADQSQSVPPQPPPYHGGGIPQFDMVEEVKPANHKFKRIAAWRKHQEEQQQKDDSETVTASSATVEQLSPPSRCEQNAVELSIDTTLPINDSPNKYNQDSCRSLMSCDSSSNNSGGGEIVMKVPQWIQSNRQRQQDLFFHLVGTKFDKVRKVTVIDIARETNCGIYVKCPDGISSKYNFFPISITFTDRTSRYDRQPTLNRLDQAREKVLELLLSFLDVKDDVGAKGRLTYDVLSSYDGLHLPMDSTSNAVVWRSPNGALRFLSLIELPFDDFYSTTILQACESQRMKSLGCLVKGYGDAFGTHLRSCQPYALVSGASWQAVDEAVEMVQAFINQHQPPPQDLPLSKRTPTTSENALLPSQTQPLSNVNSRQVYIPVEEYPTKQLVGLLVGNQGCTRRDLENRFGCRIEVLGKGTEGRKGHRAAGFGPSGEVEPPHALITGDNSASVYAASKQIESMIKERIESDDFVSLTLPLQSPYLSQSTKAISVVRMKLPLWLQQSRKEKEELFFHLVGSKADRPKFDPQRKRSLWDVGSETKCSIKINGFTRRSDTVWPPICITIGSNESSQSDLDNACEEVMHHLLDYMDFIDDAGAKERVIYEVASSYTGPHCPEDSTSKAVGWKDSNGGLRFLSLIGLTTPFILRDGCNAFHAYIQTLEKSDQMNHLSCRIKLHGDVFGVTLKYCNPYVLVSGHSWTNVDKTVEMVRNVIKTYNNRPCRFEPAQSKSLEPTQSQPPAPQMLPPKLEHNDVETPRLNAPLQRLLTNDTACSGASGEIVEDGVEYL